MSPAKLEWETMTGGFISKLTEKSKGWPESWPGLFLLQSFGKETTVLEEILLSKF